MTLNSIGELIKDNSYVGRGIIAGKSADGRHAVSAYFIMGRSENSRNRVFVKKGDSVEINAYDPAKLSDPSLIIYSPVRRFENSLIVTNGDQTDTIYNFLKEGKTFEQALETREYEPDAPNYTPRISAVIDFADSKFTYKISILKSCTGEGMPCARYTFSYVPVSGLGHFIHTYNHDGDPIPSFSGEPKALKVPDCIDSFADDIWNNLNSDNKVSLYVRYTDLETGKAADRLINKFSK